MSELELSVLLNQLTTKNKKLCIETLIKIYRNVASNPDEAKYRKLRITNKRINDEVWQHEGARMFMLSTGWELQDDESINLPVNISIDQALQILIDSRDVKPAEREWVDENKTVGLNHAKLREEALRKSALVQKAKDIAILKKDMAERKAIAKNIVDQHKRDQQDKRVSKPSVARAIGGGAIAKMSDHIKENESG